MTTETQSMRDDLAFLRALVEPDDSGQRVFGQGYFAAGVCYGVQLVLNVGQAIGLVPTTSGVQLVVGAGPTLVFVAILAWILIRHRSASRAGFTNRAVGALFGTLGCANVGLAMVIGWVAIREHSLTTWLIYPCCVFILQGAAWAATLVIRRRAWFGWVAAGWVASGLGMAAVIGQMTWFAAIASAGLLFCMALPGWHMMRAAPSPRAA